MFVAETFDCYKAYRDGFWSNCVFVFQILALLQDCVMMSFIQARICIMIIVGHIGCLCLRHWHCC